MELSLYGRVLKRWFLLILAGTILAAGIGAVIQYQSRLLANSPTYQSTASVQIICTTPCGTYVGGISVTNVENGLLPHVHDAQARQTTSARSVPAICNSVTAFIEPTSGAINVQGVAATAQDALLCANRPAQYLARLHIGNIQAEANQAIRTYRRLATAARAQWLSYVRSAALTASHKRAKKARLDALATGWLNQLQRYQTTIEGYRYPATPAATVFPAHHSSKYYGKSLSPIKTIIPAGIVGLVLSFLLAAWLESRRPGSSSANDKEFEWDPQYPPRVNPEAETSRSARRFEPDHVETVMVPEPTPLTQAKPDPAPTIAALEETVPTDADDPVGSAPPPSTQAESRIRSRLTLALADPMRQSSQLIAQLVDSSRPSIFVTSPTTAEPKSESAIGLAAALALSGKRVVLIDADPEASTSEFFGLADRAGMTDFLGYPQGPLQQLLYPANLSAPNGSLWIIPHGIRRADAMPFLTDQQEAEGPAWTKALGQLTASGVLVVVDGPAVLENPELIDSAGQMGGALVVLREEHAGSDVTQTYDVLRACGAHLLGVVANPTQARLRKMDTGGPNVSGSSGRTTGNSSVDPESGSPDVHPRASDPFRRE